MSGGSYNYLCYKDGADLFSSQHDLKRMAERLAEFGFAKDAAEETLKALLTIRQAELYLDVMIERLSGVWHAVEWCDSHDSGIDHVYQALAKYREKITPKSEEVAT